MFSWWVKRDCKVSIVLCLFALYGWPLVTLSSPIPEMWPCFCVAVWCCSWTQMLVCIFNKSRKLAECDDKRNVRHNIVGMSSNNDTMCGSCRREVIASIYKLCEITSTNRGYRRIKSDVDIRYYSQCVIILPLCYRCDFGPRYYV